MAGGRRPDRSELRQVMGTEATNEETLMNKIKTALISAVAVGTALLGAAPAQASDAFLSCGYGPDTGSTKTRRSSAARRDLIRGRRGGWLSWRGGGGHRCTDGDGGPALQKTAPKHAQTERHRSTRVIPATRRISTGTTTASPASSKQIRR